MTFEQAQALIKERLQNREANFLKVLKKGVFGYSKSPYLKLFEIAKLSYEDVERLVKQHGLEKSLEILRQEGVYFSVEEFKGKVVVKRKGVEFKVSAPDFLNPYLIKEMKISVPPDNELRVVTSTDLGLRYTSDISSPQVLCAIKAYEKNNTKISPILYHPVFPSQPGYFNFLMFTKIGRPPIKWIVPNGVNPNKASFFERIGFKCISLLAGAYGNRTIYPECYSSGHANRILDFMLDKDKEKILVIGKNKLLAEICNLAIDQNVKLNGIFFWLGGESISSHALNIIKRLEAEVILVYVCRELGHIGFSCPSADVATYDYHLFTDTTALIQHKREIVPSVIINTFLWTSLSLNAPCILINTENGDYGQIQKKHCGCLVAESGFDTHISNIRSFEKFVSKGKTFFAAPLEKLIEDVLPRQFGGESLDYQFVEEEEMAGVPRLYLYISPSIRQINKDTVNRLIYEHLDKSDFAQQVKSIIFANASSVLIRRQQPICNNRGKTLPFYIKKHLTKPQFLEIKKFKCY